MISGIKSEQFVATLARLGQHGETRHKTKDKEAHTPAIGQMFSIALSREAGTQGTTIGQEVGKQLGWHVYDNELLEEIAGNMGLRTTLLKSVDERHQSWVLETAEAYLSSPIGGKSKPIVTESSYVHHLIKAVLTLGVHGNNVIVGRGAAFILPMQTTLRVRLVAPISNRIAALSRNLHISEKEATRQVKTLDRERTKFVQDHFAKNPTDAQNYDLVLNTARFSVGEIGKLIVGSLRDLQARDRDDRGTAG